MGKFNWCGYEWSEKMEGGRIIHPNHPYAYYSDDESVLVRMRNGELHLYYRENPKEITWNGKTYNPTYETALIRTTTPFDYGTFSIEAIMPKGFNLWCAFWLSGDGNWPPEIDICEAWSENNDYFHFLTSKFPWINPSWKTTTNVHYNDKNLNHKQLGPYSVSICDQGLEPDENWIKYECIWEPEKITFKANDVVTKTVGKKYSQMLVNNLKKPEKGHLMDVVIDITIEDPEKYKNEIITPFKVRNFKYTPLNES